MTLKSIMGKEKQSPIEETLNRKERQGVRHIIAMEEICRKYNRLGQIRKKDGI